MDFYEKIISLCKQKGVSRSKMADDIGISRSTPKDWLEKGSVPQFSTVKKLADYFGVSPEDLFKEDQTVAPNTTSNDSTTGQANGLSYRELSSEALELLKIYDSLNVMGKAKLLVCAGELCEKHKALIKKTPALNKNKRHGTVTVYRAARSSDNRPAGISEVPKEVIEKLRAAPKTKEI